MRLVAANRYRAEAQIAEAKPSAAECCNSAQAQRGGGNATPNRIRKVRFARPFSALYSFSSPPT